MKQLAVMKEKLGEMKTERGRPVGAQIEYTVRLLPKQRLWNARGYINGNHPNSWKKHSCYATYVTAHASSRVMPISVYTHGGAGAHSFQQLGYVVVIVILVTRLETSGVIKSCPHD